MKTLLKVVLALLAVGAFALLFIRSAQSSRALPFAVERPHLSGWTLALAPESDQLGALLSLTPPEELLWPVTRDLFARMGESLHYAPAVMPVVLRSEYDRAIAGALAPAELLAMAREAGLHSLTFTPRCMAQQRISQPGGVRSVFFLLFDVPEFVQFRERVAARLQAAGREAWSFDPMAMSPVLIAADLDGSFRTWLPLRANPDTDCFAPVTVE
jgi:hypothetical protein